MRGQDAGFERYAKRLQLLGCMLHHVPVRLAAHDDADQWFCHGVTPWGHDMAGKKAWLGKKHPEACKSQGGSEPTPLPEGSALKTIRGSIRAYNEERAWKTRPIA